MVHTPDYDLSLNSSPSGQNIRHFTDNSFKCMNEKCSILIQISLKFVPKGSIDNKLVWIQVMAWHRTGEKPLSEPTLTVFYIHMKQSTLLSY